MDASRQILRHFPRSSTVLIKRATGFPVQVSILSSYVVFCLPLALEPGDAPWIISFSRQFPFFLWICPKYVTLAALTGVSKILRCFQYPFICLLGCPLNPQNHASIHFISNQIFFLHLLYSMSSSRIRTLLLATKVPWAVGLKSK